MEVHVSLWRFDGDENRYQAPVPNTKQHWTDAQRCQAPSAKQQTALYRCSSWEATHFRGQLPGVLRVLAVFQGSILLILWVLDNLEILYSAHCLDSYIQQYFGVRYCGYWRYSQYFGLLYCGYCQYYGISIVSIAHTASTRGAKYSQILPFTTAIILHHFQVLCGQQRGCTWCSTSKRVKLTTLPRTWCNICAASSVLLILVILAVCRGATLPFILSVCQVLRMFALRTRGYCLYSGFCTIRTASTRTISAVSTAHTVSTRRIPAVRTYCSTPSTIYQYSRYVLRKYTRTAEYQVYWEHLCKIDSIARTIHNGVDALPEAPWQVHCCTSMYSM